MQPKDFGIVLGTAILAGAAAFGAVAVHSATDTSNADLANAIATRLDRIETSIARTTEDAKAARADAAELKQRLESMEGTLHDVRERSAGPQPLVNLPAAHGRARRPIAVSSEGAKLEIESQHGQDESDLPFIGGIQMIDGELDGMAEVQDQIAKQMQGIASGFKLRSLPEDQRWAKAKEELGLNDGQVDALKQAVTARDDAMKDAMKPVKASTNANGGTITIRTMDPEKARAADEGYRSKVNQTLDESQRKAWDDKGYSHAFGRPGGGGIGVSVITSDVIDIDAKSKDSK